MLAQVCPDYDKKIAGQKNHVWIGCGFIIVTVFWIS
jgi:hypothetical protein